MNSQPTSLDAYFSEILPTLGQRQREVLKEIAKHLDITNTELSDSLGIPINAITPRVNELVKKGLVVKSQIRKCKSTGRNVMAWKYNTEEIPTSTIEIKNFTGGGKKIEYFTPEQKEILGDKQDNLGL